MTIPDNGLKGKLILPAINGMATQKDIAWLYEEAGFPVHPWRSEGTKKSARRGKGFFNSPDVIETESAIASWAPKWQCGFACSWRTGLIVLDVDDPIAFDDWEVDIPETLRVATGREGGYHLYVDFRHLRATVPLEEWPKQGDIPGGTLKSNGFVAAPGSRHPSGKLYRVYSGTRTVARGSLELLRWLATFRSKRSGSHAPSGEPGYLAELLRTALAAGESEQHEAVLMLVNALERSASREAIVEAWFPLLLRSLTNYDKSDPWDERGLLEMIGSTQTLVTTAEEERLLAEIAQMEPRIAGEEGEEWFWNSREELTKIRQWAQAQMISPWALLGEILTEIIARVPPTFVLPDLIGGYGSLNMLIAITGGSSSGKGGASAVLQQALIIDEPSGPDGLPFNPYMKPERWGAGSGEGLAKNYAYRSGKEGQVRTAYTAIVSVHEVKTLSAIVSRASETLTGELNKFYMGEPLGFGYGDPTKRINIPYFGYRGVLIAGVQPEHSGIIVNDDGSGLSRRWLLIDAEERFPPESRPPKPEAIKWRLPRELDNLEYDAERPLLVAEVCGLVANDILDNREQAYRERDRVRKAEYQARGHILFTQEKFAMGLALLAMRIGITEEDWKLSAYATERSDELRALCRSALRTQTLKAVRKEGELDAVRAMASEDVKARTADKRLWDLIQRHVYREGRISVGKLANRMRRHSKDKIRSTAKEMAKAGVIVVSRGSYQGSQETEWYSKPERKKRG